MTPEKREHKPLDEDSNQFRYITLDGLDEEQNPPTFEQASLPLVGSRQPEGPSARELLEQEEVQLKQTPKRRHPLRTVAYTLLGLILINTLLLQLAYFNRYELAKITELRPLIEQGCAQLKPYLPDPAACDIPRQKNSNAFEVLERDIRSHSSREQILSINLIYRNNAPFEQDYPTLHLEFRDISGTLIAQRSFQPEEYLKEQANIENGIAPGSTIRAQFDIVDPGSEAVNFIFSFQ